MFFFPPVDCFFKWYCRSYLLRSIFLVAGSDTEKALQGNYENSLKMTAHLRCEMISMHYYYQVMFQVCRCFLITNGFKTYPNLVHVHGKWSVLLLFQGSNITICCTFCVLSQLCVNKLPLPFAQTFFWILCVTFLQIRQQHSLVNVKGNVNTPRPASYTGC